MTRGRRQLVVAAILTLAVGEGLAHLYLPRRQIDLYVEDSDPEIRWGFRPGSRMRFEGAIYKIPATDVAVNSRGFRTREWADAAAPGAYRILALGDSVTFGWGVEEAEAWPAQLERLLALEAPYPVEALSLGVPGYDTAQEAALLDRWLDVLTPGAVVVQFSHNDVLPPDDSFGSLAAHRWLGYSGLYELGWWRWRVERSRRLAADPEEAMRRLHAGIAACALAFREMGDRLRSKGVAGVVLFKAGARDATRPLMDEAREAGFRVANYADAWELAAATVSGGLEIPRDTHPNPAGHAVLA
ncbi:MAG: hypothetical protein K8I02_00430, partial [Candidatus Methylomirabilis sp.]|nr:hypothetical protein [Deltaproteobacteria bacterium]